VKKTNVTIIRRALFTTGENLSIGIGLPLICAQGRHFQYAPDLSYIAKVFSSDSVGRELISIWVWSRKACFSFIVYDRQPRTVVLRSFVPWTVSYKNISAGPLCSVLAPHEQVVKL